LRVINLICNKFSEKKINVRSKICPNLFQILNRSAPSTYTPSIQVPPVTALLPGNYAMNCLPSHKSPTATVPRLKLISLLSAASIKYADMQIFARESGSLLSHPSHVLRRVHRVVNAANNVNCENVLHPTVCVIEI
jgi:hypothetical protein